LYNGEQFDSKIGQQYLRARYYDPATGRFNRLDPFFGDTNAPQSLHKYLYTHADPINNIDPTGNMSLGGAMMAGAIVGGIAGMSIGGVYGAVTKGTVVGTLKYAVLGGITGASIGAALAGTVWVSAYGGTSVLTNVLKLGYKDFLTKMGKKHLTTFCFL
jgi:RHS repeat-associated protein